MRQQRVLLVSVHHPELVRGGAQQVCYELFEGLKEHPGYHPTLLAAIDDSTPALFRSQGHAVLAGEPEPVCRRVSGTNVR